MNHEKCKLSTAITETLSVGQGELDENGFWEYPCYDCARRIEKEHPEDYPVWPYDNDYLRLSHYIINGE